MLTMNRLGLKNGKWYWCFLSPLITVNFTPRLFTFLINKNSIILTRYSLHI